jgi:hypothetical protein
VGRGRGDVDDVLPDPPVVGVDPREPAGSSPHRAVGALDRELRPRGGDDRVLEGDHAADQVQPRSVHAAGRLPRLVVQARRAARPRQRHAGEEADPAVLVLDVELDRVQAEPLQRDVALEPAAPTVADRDVDAADLVRRSDVARFLGLRPRRSWLGRSGDRRTLR